jgi:hypothetical protein
MSDSYQFPAHMFNPRTGERWQVTSVEEMDDYRRRGFMPDWHRRHPLGWDYCDAGWRAFFGGRWRTYCSEVGRHVIGSESKVSAAVLCDAHFAEVEAAGLVTNPYIGEQAFNERYGGEDRPV